MYQINEGVLWRNEKDSFMILIPGSKKLLFFGDSISRNISSTGLLSHKIDPSFLQLMKNNHLISDAKGCIGDTDLFGGNVFVSAPLNVTIQLTNMCNLQCIHCHRIDKGKLYLDLDKVKKLIDELFEIKVFNINFSGGEPLLYPYIVDVVQYANNKGLKTTMSTNLILRDKKMAEKLYRSGLEQIHISLDSLRPKNHDTIRGVENAFHGMLNNIAMIKNIGIKFTFVTTLLEQTLDDYGKIIDFSYASGASAHKTNLHIPQGQGDKVIPKYYKDRCLLTKYLKVFSAKKDFYQGKFDVIGESMFLVSFGDKSCTKPKILQNICPAGELTCAVTERGEVLACPFYSELSLGNINTDSFRTIRSKSRIRNEIIKNKRKNKQQCQARGYGFFKKINNIDTQSKYYLENMNSRVFYEGSANQRRDFITMLGHKIVINGEKGNKKFYDLIYKYINSKDVLELGCGTGIVAKTIGKLANKYTAIDFSKKMLDIAKTEVVGFNNLNFLLQDLNTLNFENDSFDLVIKRLAPDNFLEIYRVLKGNGHFVNFTNAEKDAIELKNIFFLPQHESKESYLEKLKNNKFNIVSTEEFIFTEIYSDFHTLSSMLGIAPILPDYENNRGFYDPLLRELFVDGKSFALTRHKLLTDVEK